MRVAARRLAGWGGGGDVCDIDVRLDVIYHRVHDAVHLISPACQQQRLQQGAVLGVHGNTEPFEHLVVRLASVGEGEPLRQRHLRGVEGLVCEGGP